MWIAKKKLNTNCVLARRQKLVNRRISNHSTDCNNLIETPSLTATIAS